jgi:hypothetical protein
MPAFFFVALVVAWVNGADALLCCCPPVTATIALGERGEGTDTLGPFTDWAPGVVGFSVGPVPQLASAATERRGEFDEALWMARQPPACRAALVADNVTLRSYCTAFDPARVVRWSAGHVAARDSANISNTSATFHASDAIEGLPWLNVTVSPLNGLIKQLAGGAAVLSPLVAADLEIVTRDIRRALGSAMVFVLSSVDLAVVGRSFTPPVNATLRNNASVIAAVNLSANLQFQISGTAPKVCRGTSSLPCRIAGKSSWAIQNSTADPMRHAAKRAVTARIRRAVRITMCVAAAATVAGQRGTPTGTNSSGGMSGMQCGAEAFVCGHVDVHPPRAVLPVLVATRVVAVASTSLALIAAFPTGAGAAALLDAQALAVLGLMPCGTTNDRYIAEYLRYFVSPVGDMADYALVLGVNAQIALLFFIGHVVVVVTMYRRALSDGADGAGQSISLQAMRSVPHDAHSMADFHSPQSVAAGATPSVSMLHTGGKNTMHGVAPVGIHNVVQKRKPTGAVSHAAMQLMSQSFATGMSIERLLSAKEESDNDVGDDDESDDGPRRQQAWQDHSGAAAVYQEPLLDQLVRELAAHPTQHRLNATARRAQPPTAILAAPTTASNRDTADAGDKKKRVGFSSRDDDEDDMLLAPHKTTLFETAAAWRFPALTYIAVVITYTGFTYGGMHLTVYADDVPYATLGVTSLLIATLFPLFAFVLVLQQRVTFHRYDALHAAGSEGRWYLRWFYPQGAWGPNHLRMMFSKLFGPYNEHGRPWFVFPLVIILVFNILTVMHPSTAGGCVAQFSLIAALYLVAFVCITAVRPFRATYKNVLTAVIYLCFALITTGRAVFVRSLESEVRDAATTSITFGQSNAAASATTMSTYLTLAVVILYGVRAMMDTAWTFLETRGWRAKNDSYNAAEKQEEASRRQADRVRLAKLLMERGEHESRQGTTTLLMMAGAANTDDNAPLPVHHQRLLHVLSRDVAAAEAGSLVPQGSL